MRAVGFCRITHTKQPRTGCLGIKKCLNQSSRKFSSSQYHATMYSSDNNSQKSQQGSDNNNASTRPGYNSGSGGSRHMACKTCRERKVRCDGGQPACEKCQRSSEECIYPTGSRKTKTDLVESMEMLQERLGTFIFIQPSRLSSRNPASRIIVVFS